MATYQSETSNENGFATGAPRVRDLESLCDIGIMKTFVLNVKEI